MKLSIRALDLGALVYFGVILGCLLGSGAQYSRAATASSNLERSQVATPPDVHFVLTNTAAAPREAKGAAILQSGALSLSTEGLTSGRYELTAVRKADGSSIQLGQLAITDPSTSPDREANDSKKQANWSAQTPVLATRTKLTLPAELQPADIAQIQVSLGGNDMLAGSPVFGRR